jgi:hypothetical protein
VTTDYFDEYEVPFEEVQQLFHMYPAPAGLLADLVEFEAYYTIRLYRDNFDKLTNMDRFATADWLQKVIQAISVLVPCYLEVWRRPGVPGQ